MFHASYQYHFHSHLLLPDSTLIHQCASLAGQFSCKADNWAQREKKQAVVWDLLSPSARQNTRLVHRCFEPSFFNHVFSASVQTLQKKTFCVLHRSADGPSSSALTWVIVSDADELQNNSHRAVWFVFPMPRVRLEVWQVRNNKRLERGGKSDKEISEQIVKGLNQQNSITGQSQL